MMFELPAWMWLLVGWCLASVCVALAMGRWFRYQR